MTPWSPTPLRFFGLLGKSLIGAFSLAALVACLPQGRILLCLLGRLCPRIADGLAATIEESTRCLFVCLLDKGRHKGLGERK